MIAPQYGITAKREARRQDRMCHSKKTYLDNVTAGIYADKVLAKHGTPVRPYKCDNCGFWHLTRSAV